MKTRLTFYAPNDRRFEKPLGSGVFDLEYVGDPSFRASCIVCRREMQIIDLQRAHLGTEHSGSDYQIGGRSYYRTCRAPGIFIGWGQAATNMKEANR